jgi:hypothetical protein
VIIIIEKNINRITITIDREITTENEMKMKPVASNRLPI